MNLLFIYSYSHLYTMLYGQRGSHHTAFASFRQEFASIPVHPLYVFSLKKKYGNNYPNVLNDDQIREAFKFTEQMGFFNSSVRDTLGLGRAYEQFYLTIIEKEKIDCIVTHNIGFGYQAIARAMAKKMGLQTLITENGYYPPYTFTLEKNGVNAESLMQGWNAEVIPDSRQKKMYEEFLRFTSTERSRNGKHGLILKELKQRLIYNRHDPEVQHHRWSERILKKMENAAAPSFRGSDLKGKRYLVFFVSSIYDPQLPSPSDQYINSLCLKIIDAFLRIQKQEPDLHLLIKEHPLDATRVRLSYQHSIHSQKNIYRTTESAEVLIEHAQGVIAINSAVGIQALRQCKPLLSVGRSVYHHKEIALTAVPEAGSEALTESIASLLRFVPDVTLIDNYLTILFCSTQIVNESENVKSILLGNDFFHRAEQLLKS